VEEEVPAEALARVGLMLRGKWRLDRLLGVGGMGWVYAATHRNKSRVAIKFLLPELARNEDMRRRFLREGYVANTIGHPGVVAVHDDDVDENGVAFLVMELLQGRTLYQLRREAQGKLPPSVVVAAADGLLEVLARAHEKNVVHRDIKPANVFITRQGRVKVLDFGIARLTHSTGRHTDENTSHGTLMGSVAYMSPEQASGNWDRVGSRSDIWAVGATLFRLLSGEHVHVAKGLPELLETAVTQPARSLGSVAPELPKALIQIVDRALSFDPNERWPDADSMLGALRSEVEGGPPRSSDRGRELSSFVYSLVPLISEPPTTSDLDVSPQKSATVVDNPRGKRPPMLAMSRHEALAKLAGFGIEESDVYLIDMMPLIEMIWADGTVQEEELRILDSFLHTHVANVNELCQAEVVSFEQARTFATRFLNERPDPELLRLLRRIVPLVTSENESGVMSLARRRAMLDFCLDIGAACVAEYPQGDRERFCREEKQLFDSIFETLTPRQS
jgi:serine/threonine protein kinase